MTRHKQNPSTVGQKSKKMWFFLYEAARAARARRGAAESRPAQNNVLGHFEGFACQLAKQA